MIHKLIVKNSLANLARYFCGFAIAFLLTPYIIKSVGDSLYGVWILVLAVFGYAGLVDMGVQQAAIKLVAQFLGEEDSDQLNGVVNTTLCFFGVAGLILCIVSWFFLERSVAAMLPTDLTFNITLFCQLVSVDIVAVFLNNAMVGVILGSNRYYFKSIVDVFVSVLKLFATVYALQRGDGIVALAAIKLGLDLLSCGAMLGYILAYLPAIRFRVESVGVSFFKKVFAYSSKVFTSSTMIRINRSAQPLIVSYFAGVIMTSYYGVITKLIEYIDEVVFSLTAVFMPLFSELQARKKQALIKETYYKYSRYLLLLSLPAYIFICIVGPRFLRLWIDSSYEEAAGRALMVLAVASLVGRMQPLSSRYLIGCGHAGSLSRIVTLSSLVCITLSVAAISSFRLVGVATAFLIANVIQQIGLMQAMEKVAEIRLTAMVKRCYGPLVLPMLIFGCAVLGYMHFMEVASWGEFLVMCLFTLAVYVVDIFLIALDREERLFVLGYVRRSKKGVVS